MRQTNVFRICHELKLMLCVLLMVFSSMSMVMADVAPTAVAINTQFPGSSNKINGGGKVHIEATWQGDTPNFTVKYKKDGTVILTDTTAANTSSIDLTAVQIGDTGNNPVLITVEVMDASGRSAEATSSQGIIVDLTAPQLNASVVNGPNFAQNSSVRIQITSNKEIKAPTVTSEGVAATIEGSLTTGTSFIYNLQLTSAFANGNHIVQISASDTTEPEASANKGTTTTSFMVGTSASGNTTITGANPGSPTNAPNVTLSGTAPSGVGKMTIVEGGSEVTTWNTSDTSWNVTIQPSEGSHSYVAVSYDSLGQEISRSTPFSLTVDRTAPGVPNVSSEGIPAQTNANSVTLVVNVEGFESELSNPVFLQGYNNGEAVGQKYNLTNQGSPVSAVMPLKDGSNSITYSTVDAAGNKSAQSAAIVINKSSSASASVASALVDNYSVPAPATAMLGGGQHSLTINYNQGLDSTLPTVEILCGGGAKITVNCSWSNNTTLTGNFSIPSNGGASYDGAATISITGAKDSYGNVLPVYTQEAAFSVDASAPVSTINGNTDVYVSANARSIVLNGTVNDGEGSGVDYLTLIIATPEGSETTKQIPLQTGAQSPWSYNFDAGELAGGNYTLTTIATDRAIPVGNVESRSGKTPIKVIVDMDLPVVSRLSLNNTGIDFQDGMVIASDVTRLVLVANDAGSGVDLINTELILNGPNGSVSGEKSNNGLDTIYFDFQTLETGDYTVSATPTDKAGNRGETLSKKFTINRSAPDSAEFFPPNFKVANETDEDLAQSQVRVLLGNSGATPSYSRSTISVKYNGVEVGTKQADDTALIAKLHGGALKADGSHDGVYYSTVVPYSSNGVAGTAINGQFTYDTLSPVVVKSSPSVDASEVWFGKNLTNLSITISDAPKDIIEHYQFQYPAGEVPVLPGDSSWYNGNGSGINMGVSSFSWTMGEQTSTAPSISGNTMTVKAPTAPVVEGDTTPGVADVNVSIVLADNANQGASTPNTTTIVKTFKFDYEAPIILLTTQSGKKFCGNTLRVVGNVGDLGNYENLRVSSIEYSDDNGKTWNPVKSNKLPAKTADFVLELDIANKMEGSYSLALRATDRAGNISDITPFSYVIDRTGPSAPELTIPLSDYSVNKRSQSFKWVESNGASAYVFQVADDASFNNILNNMPTTEYPLLKGSVSTTTDGSFSLPKDGEFFWRVAALEMCEDGYNISDYSTTRKIIIDTVKPYLLSVAPSPSSSNVVSTGMVTFTFRFSEVIDPTIELSATLTSAGGQVMKIEKVSCTGDTWTGTTVIPKNNSALYDGTAVIAIQGAKDLAGNQMVMDGSHTIIVNTGPAFTTKLFSNPANEYEITIITKSSESLQAAPSCSIKQNSVKTSVTMNFLKDRFYVGSYKIDKDNPGSAYITISGTDIHNMVGSSIVEFIIADANASVRLSASTPSGRATLKAAEGSTYSRAAVYMIPRENLDPITNNGEEINASVRASAGVRAATANTSSELLPVVGLEEIGPKSLKLKKCMRYTADLKSEAINVADTSKVAIYRQTADGKWEFQGGKIENHQISADINGFGRLALMADNSAPKLSNMNFGNLEKLKTATPEIKGKLDDNGSGLVVGSFRMAIDGIRVEGVELAEDGSFNYTVKQPLKKGKHEISIEATDRAGNVVRKAIIVDAPATFNVGEFAPYPNPARGNRVSFAYNFGGTPDSVSLKIYDTAGHLVTKFDSSDFTGPSGNLRWDLTNKKGKRVANGTYIYRLEVVVKGQKTKKRGKLAVLK